MAAKLEFYARFGVEEYYLYNPYVMDLGGWQRSQTTLQSIPNINGWRSPRLDIRFVASLGEPLQIFTPDEQPFLTVVEINALRQKAEQAQLLAEQECDQQRQRAEQLAAKLRELGVDPDTVTE